MVPARAACPTEVHVTRNIVVQPIDRPHAEAAIEMCEHKGRGHPDTITDAVCEAVAVELVRTYERKLRAPLHFNVDKGLLVGGRSEPRFGGGRILERPKLIVAGRASNPGFNLEELVLGAARGWLDAHLSGGAALFDIASEVKPGSANLTHVVGKIARANDTSFGVGYAPLSTLEQKVLTLARTLADMKAQVAAAGDDFKIMGLRTGAEFTFTVAIALVDRHVRDAAAYFAAKDAIGRRLQSAVDPGDRVLVNQLDRADAKIESDVYLTVTGLSAEMGDDGQVGRGNRVNGLITPGRPMSLEAAAGKNPYAHVGKIYNVLAHRIARRICEEIPAVSEARVQLLSTIGAPIDEPQMALVEIAARSPDRLQGPVADLVDQELGQVGEVVRQLAAGALRVY